MLDAKEIDIEIARLEYGESSYPAYAKLADLYTIRSHMEKSQKQTENEQIPTQSYKASPRGAGPFYDAVSGKDPASVYEVLEKHFEILSAIAPKHYAAVMAALDKI